MFRKSFSLTASAVTALLALSSIPAAQAALPPAEDFVGEHIGKVVISPSGHYVAILEATGPQTSQLAIASYGDGKLGPRSILNLGKAQAVDVAFKNDDRLLITVLQKDLKVGDFKTEDHKDLTTDRTLVISFKRDGSDAKILMADKDAQFGAEVQSVMANDPDHVLLANFQMRTLAMSLFKVDVNTGESERVEEGQVLDTGVKGEHRYVQTIRYSTTNDGVPYLRFDQDQTRNEVIIRSRAGSGGWSTIGTYPIIDGRSEYDFAQLASPTTVYGYDHHAQDRRSVWEYDLASGKPLKLVLTDPNGDAVAIGTSATNGQFIGATFMENGRPRTIYVSKARQAAQAALDASFTQYPINTIVDSSNDSGVLVVRSEGPGQPGVITLFDARRMEAVPVGVVGNLDPATAGQVQTISYKGSNGHAITAFLTLPARGSRNLPLIVMPHGGPEAEDTLEYDGWRQFLASRGYAVLQPQFSGSDGYGTAFEGAGHDNWGTGVQQDVRAGVLKVEADGIADPKRVCIFGWSYGGYMALAGAAFSPDLYRCAISGAGLSDVDAMLDFEAKNNGADHEVYKYWRARMGDGDMRDKESPAKHVDAIVAPILLIHGEDDKTVPIEQSEIMEHALKSAGKPVTFVRVPGERHSFTFTPQADMLRTVERFLAANLGK